MILLTPHNTDWKSIFNIERTCILQALGDQVVAIEHIGSTAIPGIYAKPVIDILVGVKNIQQFTEQDCRRVESLGYQYVPAFEEVMPDRRYFQKNNSDGVRTHQIHLVNYPSAWWEKHLLFKQYLLKHRDAAKAYEEKKLALAKQFDDTLSYANAKTDFCREIDKKAFLDFSINKPFVSTSDVNGYIPQLAVIDDYYKMLGDDTFIECYGAAYSHEQSIERLKSDMQHWDKYGFGPWMWYQQNNFVGRAGVRHFVLDNHDEVELTYAIQPQYWGRGLTPAFCAVAIDYAFTVLKLKSLICFTLHNNQQSLRVMEKLGFVYEHDFSYLTYTFKLHRLMK